LGTRGRLGKIRSRQGRKARKGEEEREDSHDESQNAQPSLKFTKAQLQQSLVGDRRHRPGGRREDKAQGDARNKSTRRGERKKD